MANRPWLAGGLSVALALATLLVGSWQARLKTAQNCRLIGPFWGFAGAETGLKTTRARGIALLGSRDAYARPFLCPNSSPRELIAQKNDISTS